VLTANRGDQSATKGETEVTTSHTILTIRVEGGGKLSFGGKTTGQNIF